MQFDSVDVNPVPRPKIDTTTGTRNMTNSGLLASGNTGRRGEAHCAVVSKAMLTEEAMLPESSARDVFETPHPRE